MVAICLAGLRVSRERDALNASRPTVDAAGSYTNVGRRDDQEPMSLDLQFCHLIVGAAVLPYAAGLPSRYLMILICLPQTPETLPKNYTMQTRALVW